MIGNFTNDQGGDGPQTRAMIVLHRWKTSGFRNGEAELNDALVVLASASAAAQRYTFGSPSIQRAYLDRSSNQHNVVRARSMRIQSVRSTCSDQILSTLIRRLRARSELHVA